MARRSLGSLFIDIEARTARLEADLARTRGILARMSSQVSTMGQAFGKTFALMRTAVVAFASVQTVRMLTNMAMAQYENVRSLTQMADATGLTVSQLQAYNKAAEHYNVTNVDMAKVMQQLFKKQAEVREGTKGAAKDFERLGMSAQFVREALPDQLFESTVQGLSRLSDASQRGALATEMLGKQAKEMTPLIIRGASAIKEARQAIDDVGASMSRMDIAKVRVALEAINNLQDRWEAFKQRLSIALTPVFYNVANFFSNLLNSLDVEDIAEKFTQFLVKVYAFVVTLPEQISRAFNTLKLRVLELVQIMKLDKLLGFENIEQSIADTTTKLEALEATIGQVGTVIETDFTEQVKLMLQNIGGITMETKQGISEASLLMVQAFTSSFDKMADVLADFAVDGEMRLGDFARTVVKTMISTFAKLSIINPLMNGLFGTMMGGTGGGWWDALPTMMSGRKRGGPVMAGETVMVGENGPEPVTFGRSAYVTPADRVNGSSDGGGPTVQVIQNFQTGMTQREFQSAIPIIIQQTKAAVADGVARGGAYSRAVKG